nr:MAG TPA: hypothetical protein [Caudoviricetes sp.]
MLYIIIIGFLIAIIYTTYKWYKTYSEYIEYKEKVIEECKLIKEKVNEIINEEKHSSEINDSYNRLSKNEPLRVLPHCNIIQQIVYNVENSYMITDFSGLKDHNVVIFYVGINESPPSNVKTFEMNGKHIFEKFSTNCVLKDFGNNYYTWEIEKEWESHENWKKWKEKKEDNNE